MRRCAHLTQSEGQGVRLRIRPGQGTTLVKPAARGRIAGAWQFAGKHDAPVPPVGIERGIGREQRLCVRMRGRAKQRRRRPALTKIHHRYPIRDAADHAKIVGYQQEAETVAERAQ